MAEAAVECWRRQDWPNTELVIVDDDDCPAFASPLPFEGLCVQYVRLPKRLTIGAKRNQACAMARGEFIAHFDSDDWSAPERLADQMRLLEQNPGKAMTGYHTILFTDGTGWWRFDGPDFQEGRGAFGTTFFYQKDWWREHPFEAKPTCRTDAEDNPFVRRAMAAGGFVGAPAGFMMFARIHRDNTSPKGTSGSKYVPIRDGAELVRCRTLGSLDR